MKNVSGGSGSAFGCWKTVPAVPVADFPVRFLGLPDKTMLLYASLRLPKFWSKMPVVCNPSKIKILKMNPATSLWNNFLLGVLFPLHPY